MNLHFTLPDYRGYFLRGWDHTRAIDPDRSTRTDRGDGVVGDYVGTLQSDQNKSHVHAETQHVHPPLAAELGFVVSEIGTGDGESYTGTRHHDDITTGLNAASNTASSGGNETRPVNINVMWVIKY